MKNLIIYCHPNPKSFNYGILETIIQNLKEKGEEVQVRDLYSMNFNPIKSPQDFIDTKNNTVAPDIKAEQDYLLWSDRIVFIYPVWWMNMPALLKGYIDRVFNYGFAYSYNFRNLDDFKLAGKKVLVFNTSGAPKIYYLLIKALNAMNKITNTGIFKFCKMKVLGHYYYGGIPRSTDSKRKKILLKIQKIIRSL